LPHRWTITPLSIRIQIPRSNSLPRYQAVKKPAEVSFIHRHNQHARCCRLVAPQCQRPENRTFTAISDVAETADRAPPRRASGAQLRISPGARLDAHFVSPAILSLDTDGRLDQGREGANKVHLPTRSNIRAARKTDWHLDFRGLPETAQISSTIGQGI